MPHIKMVEGRGRRLIFDITLTSDITIRTYTGLYILLHMIGHHTFYHKTSNDKSQGRSILGWFWDKRYICSIKMSDLIHKCHVA